MGTFKSCKNITLNQGQYKCNDIKIYEETGSVITGNVLFPDGKPVSQAVVILNAYNRDGTITPVSFTFTNIYGQFTFGVKNTNTDYVIEVTYNETI